MRMGDNTRDECLPFKGPFKGKGQNRKAARFLGHEAESIRDEMKRIVEQFNETFSKPRPVNLRVHGRGRNHPMLSWRLAVHGGSYLHLFGSEDGERLLSGLGPNTVRKLAEFDRHRLHLNFKSKIIFSMLMAYQIFMDGQESEAAWFDGRSRNPMHRTG